MVSMRSISPCWFSLSYRESRMSSSKKMVIRSRARGMDSRKRTAACCESFSILSMLSLVSRRRPRSRASVSSWPGCTARANTCTDWGRPSSWTVKSSRVRSDTNRPWPSRTVRVTLTTSVPVAKTGGWDFSWASAGAASAAAARKNWGTRGQLTTYCTPQHLEGYLPRRRHGSQG